MLYVTNITYNQYGERQRIDYGNGTMKNLGLLCENVWPGSQDIVEEMSDKTIAAGNVLTADYDTFEKELQLPEPFLYRTFLLCVTGDHEPDHYDAYWYHPDHLGSSSYITNTSGEVSQHIEYLPFGETLVEEHLNSYNSPYKFNAKEFDAETGWYYYGARYYNPKWSIWLGVDPLAEMYPSMSPYAYTLQNPVRYIDPTGMVVESPDDIRFRDKDGNLLATYHIDPDIIDVDVYLPFSSKVAPNVNLNKYTKGIDEKLNDIDVLGIGGNWDFTAAMGGGYSAEAIFFLDGKDKGCWELYETNRQNVGVNGSYGAYLIAANYTGDKGDANMTSQDFTGPSYAITAGFETSIPGKNKNISLGGSMFWAPKDPLKENKFGTHSLLNKQERAWTGYSINIIGAGGGAQYSIQDSRKWEDRKYFK